MTGPARAALAAAAWDALAEVRDPELDEPITELGFVSACEVTGEGKVLVRLRLPTAFCAPNFAFLMAADARDALRAAPGVRHAEVRLEEHVDSAAINDGVAARRSFLETFGELAADELDELRAQFLRKAVLARTDAVCRVLVAGGRRPAELAELAVRDASPSPDLERLLACREALGLPAAAGSPLVVDPASGGAVSGAEMALHLGKARLTRVSAEANGAVCRGLLGERSHAYPIRTSGRGRAPVT